jgi:FkbM family methyltransferase
MLNTAELLALIGRRIGKPRGWERIVRLFVSPEKCATIPELCLVRDGSVFLAQPAVQIGWHVAFFGSYEPEIRDIFRTVLPLGGVALDIGANVGWHTLLMARLVGDQGRVLAAEPNPSVRKRLLNNLNLNRFNQVDVVPYAIADTEGTVEFFGPEADDGDSGNGYIVNDGSTAPQETIRVETRRLDAIVAAAQINRLDLIKIDVEGFEWPVLQGGEQTITKFRPHIILEYDANYASRGGGSPSAVLEFFREHGYRLFTIGRTWATAVELSNWPDCANIWAVPFAES